ncbi:MAG TPA: HAD family hydrolase [Longimicrobiales bacterium]|nr:HAD family hydrolase [Longimicrobiales bacterium]
MFVDRDGTLIEERDYLADPAGVALLPGAAAGLRRLARAGLALVLVTNQSGIARGRYGEAEYARVQARLEALLASEGVRLDGAYHCPHHPDFTGPCDCRKPQPGLFVRAARELGLDLTGSTAVGDRLRDVVPVLALGGKGILVRTGYGREEEPSAPTGVTVVDDLEAAARRILSGAASRQ